MNNASVEFGIDRKTIVKRLAQASLSPGEDNCFSTEQICTAIFSSLERERIRLTSVEADIKEMEKAEKRKELINIEELIRRWSKSFVRQKAIVMASKLTEQEKFDLLTEMEKVATDG